MKRSIVELMSVPSNLHDLQWLQDSLQSAISLELSTLPPYLCAYWSIKDSGPAQDLVRSVVLEEMLHLGLVCNMLTAIGSVPNLTADLPNYPGPLPGGVRPELTVYLAGLSRKYLQNVCMQIEYPENGPVALRSSGSTYPTIGAFYDAIALAFAALQPALTATNQLDGATLNGYPLYTVTTLADVEKAIEEIKEQGEGTWKSPDAIDFGGELAHYYKFAEIFYGNEYVQQSDKTWAYNGPAIPFPDVYPMAPVPAGGYPNPSATVAAALQNFNLTFSSMLEGLQAAWANGSEDALSTAIRIMCQLKSKAVALMNMPLPDGSGNVYGPDFQLAKT